MDICFQKIYPYPFEDLVIDTTVPPTYMITSVVNWVISPYQLSK